MRKKKNLKTNPKDKEKSPRKLKDIIISLLMPEGASPIFSKSKKVFSKKKLSLRLGRRKTLKEISPQAVPAEAKLSSKAIGGESLASQKFDVGLALKEEETVRVRLPQRYFDNRIVLLTRDPWWIHAYWDISEEREKEVLSKIHSEERQFLRKILRVYDVSGRGEVSDFNSCEFFDIEINSIATNWYINVNKPGASFCVEIGYLTPAGRFFPLARSNITRTPYFGISEQIDEEWVLPEEEYYRILGVYDLGKSSLERRKALRLALEKGVSSLGASGLFSPLLRKKKEKEFFFEVYTELIIYGRTHPQATVTLKGEKINLKSDGTFHLRFHLPLGKFEFPFKAVSPSGEDKIEITPVVERTQK